MFDQVPWLVARGDAIALSLAWHILPHGTISPAGDTRPARGNGG